MPLTCQLTHIVGPAVPRLVLVWESGVKRRCAIVFKFGFNVLSHFHFCQAKQAHFIFKMTAHSQQQLTYILFSCVFRAQAVC